MPKMNRAALRREVLDRWLALDANPDRDVDEDELLEQYDQILERLDRGDDFQDEDSTTPQPTATKPEPERLDAMALSGEEVAAVTTALLGGPVIVNGGPLRFSAEPQRRPLDPRVQAHIDEIAARRRAHEERAAALDAGRIEGRTADPAKMRARLNDLGIDPHLGTMFRSPAVPPLPPDKPNEDPATTRRRLQAKADRRIEKLRRSGQRIDVRRLSREEYEALLRARGIEPAKSFGARGIPEPR